MSAPRLLDKRIVNVEQAAQQRQKIVEGITLAKKVDAVRDSLSDEQTRLEKFRIENTKRVQEEIDAKIMERDAISRENEKLRSERQQIILHAFVDLEQEWEKVNHERETNQVWQSNLINQQVDLLAREADSQTLSEALHKRDSLLKEKEILAGRTLTEAEKSYVEASEMLENSKNKSKEIYNHAVGKEREVEIREQELSIWNEDLQRLERELKEKDFDLSNREIALQRRYETFLKAQNYMKNKK